MATFLLFVCFLAVLFFVLPVKYTARTMVWMWERSMLRSMWNHSTTKVKGWKDQVKAKREEMKKNKAVNE